MKLHMEAVKELSWTAGFWEGEGSCGYYIVHRKRAHNRMGINHRLTVTISQVDRTPLDKIAKLFNVGNVRKVPNVTTLGRDKNAYIHVWMISCRSARLFLNTILPYVIGEYKRNQIIKALKTDSNDR